MVSFSCRSCVVPLGTWRTRNKFAITHTIGDLSMTAKTNEFAESRVFVFYCFRNVPKRGSILGQKCANQDFSIEVNHDSILWRTIHSNMPCAKVRDGSLIRSIIIEFLSRVGKNNGGIRNMNTRSTIVIVTLITDHESY